jgi:hypothetical protein
MRGHLVFHIKKTAVMKKMFDAYVNRVGTAKQALQGFSMVAA